MYLVTGATGNVGGQVVARLSAEGQPVRAFCRHPERKTFPAGVEVVAGDMADAAAARAALRGVTRLFVVRTEGLAAFWTEVARSEARHVVFLSSGAITLPVETQIGRAHAETEAMIRDAAATWSFVRAGGFMSNALRWAPGIRAAGVVRVPFVDGRSAPVDPRDLGDAAAAMLLQPERFAGAAPEVTGPEVLSTRQQVAILADALGRPIHVEEVPEAVAREQMLHAMPAPMVDSVFALMRHGASNQNPQIRTAETITGRPPRTFAQWAADHREAFL